MFNVISPKQLLNHTTDFSSITTECLPITQCVGRILAQDIIATENIPPFRRSTMDGYAVNAKSTYGASESNPTLLFIKETIEMGKVPEKSLDFQEAAKIATGGMLPQGADSVVMVEYSQAVDESTVEIYKSVAPLQHVIDAGEDIAINTTQCRKGQIIRPQDLGAVAALGIQELVVYEKPVVGIISTGDEIVPISQTPRPGEIRDINQYSLFGQIMQNGGQPVFIDSVPDDFDALYAACSDAIQTCHMVLISGGSSVGMRDYTIDVIQHLHDASIIAHGVAIQPGKPTILAKVANIPVWGLPGHAASAMIVFYILVRPFLRCLAGEFNMPFFAEPKIKARLTRNIASSQGREEYVRVKLEQSKEMVNAIPIQGKSGLIRTMVQADGLIVIPENVEGLEKGIVVEILLI
ncbi:MAG: molybdopterin biosynthesis protein MoeA [Candidatus Magnetoglobus multicellularis str. Araruama]|uniref:Molybdopterin molybdenumtransferase n=1 Tax=Candidatus Magnetoglobus multicellularis str. Araruama TaxID=890399 RepID=A0A1V1P5C9_9BACT|nr:MAG: molybdopterin biosynthesis protein MoeA [Candidatus Magnetoglobus multicellularis str. Araruama]